MRDPTAIQVRINELLEQWEEASENGKPVPVVQLCSACPELIPDLELRIESLRRLERPTSSIQLESIPRAENETGNSPSVVGSSDLQTPAPSLPPTLDAAHNIPTAPISWPTIEGYQIESILGEGGMGTVYRAREVRLDRLVALKMMRDPMATTEQRARFEVEAQSVARMQHQNIVQIFGIGQWQPPVGPPSPFLAFEYVAGGDLETLVRGRAVPPQPAARLVQTIAIAIDHAHRKGIIHRDLKPANILLHPVEGRIPPTAGAEISLANYIPKVADFGLARHKMADAKLTQTGSVLGTATYMAPEQAKGLEVGPPADIYALGGILYKLITGRAPFEAKTAAEAIYQVCHKQPVKPRSYVPSIPATLESICLRCLAKKPADRYPDAAALAADLQRFISGQGKNVILPVQTPSRTRITIAGSLLALFAIGALGIIWFVKGPVGNSGPDPGSIGPAWPPLRLEPITVSYYRLHKDKKGSNAPVVMGDGAMSARFDDAVTLSIKSNEPLYFYVLGFNAKGIEELLWPCDANNTAAPKITPEKIDVIPKLPLGNNQFRLDEDPAGGLQVYVLVASRLPLLSYTDWLIKRNAISWKRQTGFEGVWRADDREASPIIKGKPPERSVQSNVGVPPLVTLCQELKSAGVEAVEAIAFPVLPK